ncbi:hypothetical protein HanRHA438_Chr04g0184331 [Helianthus annuus]|uniref:Transposase (Putative), gypsy type n=1 Tax=Helianthus annuus TaxID=4232 RepID=A0A9K3J8P0_HELAN|nr:hypothetical protein HanXRQr2_Chr04g0174731 [Helianthus annuus]KAJ0597576.1 hypothetical protein HanHA89_Chr04g0156231 [Helianthus annuus]KAJ0758223.1 hypothetical protein HanLR1_Chr04g0147951 [Helianthus annuus]KAJ0761883.1 hypothetical protein HanOQP8_Chr04g0155161 [Helianthus annuus]KAJ0927564.1 hypothetical protein HanRHA438_Chr04g0184331 [Helianthus annuus]
MPLTSGNVMSSAAGGPSLSDLISQASAVAVSSSMPPPVFTAVVSPIGVSAASEKKMPATSIAGETTSARDVTVSDTRGSSSGFLDDGAHLSDDLYLPTIYWDPNVQDKLYQPMWKIAESSRLIFPPVVHHWVERAYPPAESVYVEGLNNENLMNATMVDAVSQPRRLAEIRRRWMHDNNELHQARITIQELMDEKYRLESQLQAAGPRESRFVFEKNKAEDDLKRVTANLAKERILWARDIAEKYRVLAHAKNVQEELERKVVVEAQKVQERYQGLTVELEASNAKVQAKQAELEEREEQLRKLQQVCDSLVSEKNQLVQSSTTH